MAAAHRNASIGQNPKTDAMKPFPAAMAATAATAVKTAAAHEIADVAGEASHGFPSGFLGLNGLSDIVFRKFWKGVSGTGVSDSGPFSETVPSGLSYSDSGIRQIQTASARARATSSKSANSGPANNTHQDEATDSASMRFTGCPKSSTECPSESTGTPFPTHQSAVSEHERSIAVLGSDVKANTGFPDANAKPISKAVPSSAMCHPRNGETSARTASHSLSNATFPENIPAEDGNAGSVPASGSHG